MSKLKKIAMDKTAASTLDYIVSDVDEVKNEITDALNYAKEAIKYMDILDSNTPVTGYFQERIIDKLEAMLHDNIFKMIDEALAEAKKFDY